MKDSRLAAIAVILGVAALYAALYHDLLSGESLFVHDSIVYIGEVYYTIESFMRGTVPLWDPYTLTGTPHYPHISWSEMLVPFVYPLLALRKLGLIDTLTTFVYMRLLILAIFAAGAYFLFRHITKNRIAAAIAGGVLLFASAPIYSLQPYVIFHFLIPFAILFFLLFVENLENKRRYLYLFCFVFIFGIGMNVTAPVALAFNLVFFFLTLMALGIIPLKTITNRLGDKKLLVSSAIAVFALLLMSGPMLALYKDSVRGEIFPHHRMVLKNWGVYKKIVATDVAEDVLSDRFNEAKGVYSSTGNIVNLLYPDFYMSYFSERQDYFKKKERISEILMFIGIVPFVLALIGLIYGTSRYRWVALIMLIVVGINLISLRSVVSSPNFLQKFFNFLFPPLKIVEAREVFGAAFLFYLCMLLAIGLKEFFENASFRDSASRKFKGVLIVIGATLCIKTVITVFVLKEPFYASRTDLISIALLIFFGAALYLHAKGILSRPVFFALFFSFLFSDLAVYNYAVKSYVLKPNSLKAYLEKETRDDDQGFEYRRSLFADFNIAYGDAMLRKKGAMTGAGGYEYQLFTTKRYYDVLTNVPVENQFMLNGMVYPIIRIFPVQNVRFMKNKTEALNTLAAASLGDLRDNLYLEDASIQTGKTPSQERLKRFSDFEDLKRLTKKDLKKTFAAFTRGNAALMKKGRDNASITSDARTAVKVIDFSSNRIRLSAITDEDAYLLYNDGWSKYWRAFDNGKKTPIYIANYNSKAVYLSKGVHLIEFVYRPTHYETGLILYGAGLLISLTLAIIFYVKSRATVDGSM